MSVKRGVREFSIPVSDDEMPVSAAAKRNAGIKFPNIPIPRNFNQSFLSLFFMCLNENGSRNKNAIIILSEATCEDENASSPRFISIKELPQIRASNNNIDQFKNFEFIFCKGNRVEEW